MSFWNISPLTILAWRDISWGKISWNSQEYIDDYILTNKKDFISSKDAYDPIPLDGSAPENHSQIMEGQSPVLISNEEVMDQLYWM